MWKVDRTSHQLTGDLQTVASKLKNNNIEKLHVKYVKIKYLMCRVFFLNEHNLCRYILLFGDSWIDQGFFKFVTKERHVLSV